MKSLRKKNQDLSIAGYLHSATMTKKYLAGPLQCRIEFTSFFSSRSFFFFIVSVISSLAIQFQVRDELQSHSSLGALCLHNKIFSPGPSSAHLLCQMFLTLPGRFFMYHCTCNRTKIPPKHTKWTILVVCNILYFFLNLELLSDKVNKQITQEMKS